MANRLFSGGQANASHYIIPFEAAAGEPIARIGGKCAGLAALASANAPVSPGFAITTEAFAEMMAIKGLGKEIGTILASLDVNDIRNEAKVSREIESAIIRRPIPPQIEKSIRAAYNHLCSDSTAEVAVAVRSSGTGEDLPDASFAGQGNTYLSVVGADSVVDKVRKCWASLYTARAISYRAQCGIGQLDVQMAVAVQMMVDARSAGVAMTLDPSNGDRSKIVIEVHLGPRRNPGFGRGDAGPFHHRQGDADSDHAQDCRQGSRTGQPIQRTARRCAVRWTRRTARTVERHAMKNCGRLPSPRR